MNDNLKNEKIDADTGKEELSEGTFRRSPAASEDVPEGLSFLPADVCLNQLKRALADYSNLQKNVAKEREQMTRFAVAEVALKFIDVYEHFKRALQHTPTDLNPVAQNWCVGVQAIRDLFAQVLQQLGITEIKTLQQQFDPTTMEAMGEKESDAPAGTVVEEISGGYRLGDKILKPAQVVTSKNNN